MKTPLLLVLILFITKIGQCQCATTSSSITIGACSSYHWTANNVTYTNSGIYTYTSLNTAGCDSVQTLNLNINSPNQWTWMSGTNGPSGIGIYGTLGITSSSNKPGGRSYAVSWKDNSGNFWLMGGQGQAINGTGLLNDLWKYNINNGQWTWMSGSNTRNQAGVYGAIGVPALTNNPGARQNAISWTDDAGNLWIFGGFGYDINSSQGFLNDLWKYNISTGQWTWVGGSNIKNQVGVYGSIGGTSSLNWPRARYSSVCWKDNNGNLWLMGGIGTTNGIGGQGAFNDLWKYNISNGQWTWMGGSNLAGQIGVYGTIGISSSTNKPGARFGSVGWTDNSNNLWLMGGGNPYLNDLWKYNISNGQWTWMSGSNLFNQVGEYGTLGIPSTSTVPGGRMYSSCWNDNNGNLWLKGGDGYEVSSGEGFYSDLWKYTISTGLWTWVGGSNNIDQQGVYGVLGVTSPTNSPGSRFASVTWTDNIGNFWFMGGIGTDIPGSNQSFNDLWKYTPPCNSITSSSNLTVCNSYTWNGTSYTTSGAYTHTYISSNGIDSIHTLNLTVNYSTTNGNATVTSCDSYLWNGTTYTASGTYTYTSLNAQGCTNTATLTLTINHSSTNGNATITVCNSYIWNGTTYTTNGTYTSTSLNTQGCVNTATLTLTINHSTTNGNITVTACNSYTWNGTTYTASGVYTNTSLNINGCLNTAILNLTINPTPIANAGVDQTILSGSIATLTANGGGTYLWSTGETNSSITVTPSTTTTYTVTVTNSYGCSTTDVVQVNVLYNSLLVTPASYDYGNVVVGYSSVQNLTVTNNGTSPIIIDSLPGNLPFATFFVSQTLNAGSTINIPITFNANAALIYSKMLTLYTSIGNFTFQRTGKGVAPAPAWIITPNNYTFGNVNIGNISTYNFTITNTGNIPISIGAVALTNPVFAGSTSASDIAVGSNATFTVSFAPLSIVSYNGVTNINSPTVGLNPLTLTLYGNGIVQGTPPVLKFVTNAPYNNVSGVNPHTGFPGNYTYQVLYKSSTNLPPQAGYPKLGIDKNGDGDFTDGSEGVFTMAHVNSGTPDYINGEIFSYTTTLSIGSQYGYQFIANDSLGNPAVGINTGYSAGPMVTNETLDLSIYANDITFSIPNPAVNQPFTIYATVHNTSPYPASNVNIKFYKDSIYLTNTVVPFIDANSDALVSFNWSFATDGWYPIKVWIDSGGALGETNPLNNYAIRPITVGQFSLPGSILINATASPQSCPVPGVLISGSAVYDGLNLAGNPPVLGANVTIVINGETLQTTTGFNGYYSIFYNNNGAGLPCNTLLPYSVIVTDFTFTSTTLNQSVNIPCVQCGNGSGVGYYSFVSNASTPQCLIELAPINYQVHLFNYGTLNSYHDTIKVFAEGNLINTFSEDSIVTGQTKNYNNSVTLTSGAHTMSFIHTYYDGSNNMHNESFSNTIYVQTNLPDFYLGYFYQNGPTGFHVTNYNGNCSSAGASKIYIYDSMSTYSGEVLIDSINTIGLNALGYDDYNFNKPNWTKGYHYLRLKTDAPLIIPETNENNNTLNAVIYVPFPELSVGTIDVSNTNVSNGSQVNFSAVIQNSGASCGSFKVRFLANGIPVGNDIIVAGGMNANSNQLVTSDIYTITNSSCPDSISVIVDADNTITELYENNNIGTYLFGRDFTSGVPYFGMGSFFNPYLVQVLNPASLSTIIHNIGTRDASDVKVSFTLNGNVIGMDTIPALGANTNIYSSISHIFNSAGDYVIQVYPDFDDTLCEMNESNNVGEIYVTVYGLPDLQILSQDVSPSGLNPAPGQNISIVSSVHSIGTIPSSPTAIRFYVDNVQLGNDVIIDSLYPGQDTTVACTALYSSMVVGPKIIKVKADVFNSMTESIESNNEATRTIIVGGAPDFAHSVHQSITFSQPTFRKGDNIQVCNYIRNYGGDTGTAWIKFYEKSNGITNLIDSVQFTLNDHDSNQICVNWSVGSYVGQIITRISGSNPPEYNVLNNDDSLSFTAGPKLFLNASMTPSGIALGASSLATCTSLNDGQAVTYQWYKNGIQISGNSLNYTISNTTIADAGYYVLKGTDTFGIKSSNTVTLTVDNYLTPTMTVPVVVHVMNTGEPIGTENNPSDEEIKASIDYMNTEYNGTAAGTELGVGNTFIQFALAKRSPNDSCTNGITRHNLSANTSYNDYGVKFAFNGNTGGAIGMNDIDLKNTVRWDPTKYVNIWLVTKINGNTGNIFITPSNNGSGYVASLADYQSDIDGIVLKSWFVHYTPVTTNVSIKTQIAHEMGHILNLYHVFEGNCPISSQCSSNGDYICDTDPVTKIDGLSPRSGINTCNGNPFSDYTERNIMSYTTEPRLFTPDQRTRMHDALTTLSYRMSLVNTTTNNSLVPPLPDLIITNPSSSTIPVNANSLVSVSFSEKNIGGITANANYVNIHLSNDNVLTPGQNGDVYLGQYLVPQVIPPNSETLIFTTQVLIPATVTTGSYYLFFAADAQGQQVTECIEDNNFAMTNIDILDCTTTSSQSVTDCDSYIWACNGITYTSSGTYTCTSLNANGCVNNSNLNLTINQSTVSSANIHACGSYTWAASGLTYSTTGVYTKTSLNASGCLNSETLNLIVDPPAGTTTLSACNSYFWPVNGITYTNSGSYTFTLFCGIYVLNLTINPTSGTTTNSTACDSYSWAANNVTYTSSGTYTNSNPNGCETDILNLTINHSTTSSITVTSCNSYTWSDNGLSYSNSGSYTYTSLNSQGCVNTSTLTLTINHSSAVGNATITACNSYLWNGTTYTASGTYTYTSLNSQGCVNTATLTLTINHSSTNGNATITACNSYTWNGTTYTASGTYTYTSLNSQGCVNTSTLTLTINHSSAVGNATITACNSYLWNGTTYTSSGTYTYTSLNAQGCTNTATLTLTINHSTTNGNAIITACNSYTWNGTTYTASGTYTYTSLNSNGCVNSAILNLTITATSGMTNISACDSYTWSVNGVTYTNTGTYTQVNSCGNDTLNLTLTQSSSITTTVVACGSYQWPINTATYNTSGTYNYVNGCHTEILNLTINSNTSNTTNVTQTLSYTWPVNNITYTVAGTYTVTSLNVSGCIHSEILNLSLNSSYTAVLITVTNLIQTSPSEFQYDVFCTNTGTTSLALRGYSWGLNLTSDLNGIGFITHSFVSRDSSLLNIPSGSSPNPTVGYLFPNHLRGTTSNTLVSNAVSLTPGVPIRLATCRVNKVTTPGGTTPLAWTGTNLNPFLPSSPSQTIQVITAPGKTQCITTMVVTPPGLSYAINGISNSPTFGVLPALTANMIPSPTSTAPFLLNACNNTFSTSTISSCNSYNWLTSGQSYTISGNYTHTNVIGSSDCINTDTLHLTIVPMDSNITNVSACHSYTWLANGVTYTNSGIYIVVSGCHTELLNLTINSCLNLKCLIEGYWNGSNEMVPVLSNQFEPSTLSACDSIDVELHDESSPFGIVQSIRSVLNTDGTATCVFPFVTGSYYIVVKHRNALQTWSSVPVNFTTTPTIYDFTNGNGKAFGNNQVEVYPGMWAFHSGDLNQDENIDLIDASILEPDINSFQFGYFSSDLNGDGNVDLLDSPILETNINNFVFSNHP